MKTYITSARLVLDDQTVADGALCIDGEIISAVCPASAPRDAREIDLQGSILMPGLVDIHSDDIEIQVEPRQSLRLPLPFAIFQMDRGAAMSGITTMYPSLSFCGNEAGPRCDENAAEIVRAIHDMRDCLLVDHRPHCRFEVTNEPALPLIEALIAEGACGLVSLMDHTPGQGQFPTSESYRRYYQKRYGHDEKHVDVALAEKMEGARRSIERIHRLAERTRAAGLPLASHDDDHADRVELMREVGATISEFPLNLAAAATARARGLRTVFGAPNVFRGGSQGHGIRAIDAIAAGHADALASDYLPASMVSAAFRVAADCGFPLHQAVKLVTANPAEAVGLADRGRLAAGLRADLIAVRHFANRPQVVRTWSRGRMAYAADYPR